MLLNKIIKTLKNGLYLKQLMKCEIDGKITYKSWRNRGSTEEKGCSYNNGWSLVMDLGYNHMRYHFMAEYGYDKNFKNPFDQNNPNTNPEWNNGCSSTKGIVSFYGSDQFIRTVFSHVSNYLVAIPLITV